jgi:ribose transport system substrate-binding protein
MTTTFERRQSILRLLREQPGVRVPQLSSLLNVSEGTIRNDLNALEAEQRLRRVRGGAVLLQALEAMGTAQLNGGVNTAAKRRIACWAAELVEDGDAIIMDASTTVQGMVPFLQSRQNLTIVTNSLDTAHLLDRHSDHTVILIGGVLNGSSRATTGLIGSAMLANLHIRTAFVSGVGFTPETGLTERHLEEAELKKKMLAAATKTVALLDSTKLGKVGLAPFATLEQISTLFTDSDVPAEFVAQMRATGVNLMVCGENTVRSHTVHGTQPNYTLGFANQSEELPFAIDVRRGLERAVAAVHHVDMVYADNKLSGEEALRVANKLIGRNVDLAIEYQIDYGKGSLIMDKFRQANIPVIAVDIPMVGATFFGVDNYRCGHVAGVALGQWLLEQWDGEYDRLIVLEEPRAGSLPAARIQGQLDGVAEILGEIPQEKVITLDCGNTSSISEAQMTRAMQTLPEAHRLAVISFNTDAAIGALRAARRLGREGDLVIVGQGADRLLLDEIRRPESRVIGSTAYMPELYGDKLLELALKILQGESVPPAVYTEHVFLTAENIDRYYPRAA